MKKTQMPNIIIGLGNYGSKYDLTRHNIGFSVLDYINSKAKWNLGEHNLWCINKFHNAILIKPITGMNLSGLAAKDIVEATNHNIENIIVIHDYMDFDPGQIKIKVGGGDGRHNGIKSVIKNIGPDFIRIRIGIGKPKTKEQGASFVLETFSSKERKLIDSAIDLAAEAVSWIIQDGVQKAMAKFNK